MDADGGEQESGAGEDRYDDESGAWTAEVSRDHLF